MTAQEKLAPLAAKLHAALADEKQRVNLLVCTGLAGLVLLGVTAWLPAGNSTQSPQTSADRHSRRLRHPAGKPSDRADFPRRRGWKDRCHGHAGIRQ